MEHKRVQFNMIRRRYRDRRLASDPVFRLRERQRARERYVKSRLRIGKTPAVRAPIAPARGLVEAFMAAFRQNALTALRRLEMRFRG